MSREYKAKVFKSGNSLALRLPKALGLEEGAEMTVREEHGRYVFRPTTPKGDFIDLTGIWGSCPGLKPLSRDEREFDDPPRDWDLLGEPE